MTKRVDYLLIALAASLMLVIALGRWLSLASNAWDLGIFTQFSWMLSRGYFSEPASLTGWPVLADHASFVLVPISFLYRFWSSPAYLLTLQVFALIGASLILLQIVKAAGLPPKFRSLILLAYLCQPALWNTSWFDFHSDALFPLVVFSFWLNVRQRNVCRTIFCLIMILLIREAGVLVALGLSLTCLIQGRRKIFAVIAIFSISWALFLTCFWYPLFNLTEQHNSNNYSRLLDAVHGFYLQQFSFNSLVQALDETSLSLAPSFFLSLILPWFIFMSRKSIPWIAGSLLVLTPLALSSNANLVSIDYHYGIMIAPFYALAAVESAIESPLLNFSIYKPNPGLIAFSMVSIINLVVNLNLSPGWIVFWRNPWPFLQYYEHLARIPADQRVLTSNGLSAHIANRREADFVARNAAQLFPEGFDMLILNKTDPGFGSSPNKSNLLIQAAKKSGWRCDSLSVGHLEIQECSIK